MPYLLHPGRKLPDLEILKIRENFQTRLRGTLKESYDVYIVHADDGNGGDITRNGAPLLTFKEWLKE